MKIVLISKLKSYLVYIKNSIYNTVCQIFPMYCVEILPSFVWLNPVKRILLIIAGAKVGKGIYIERTVQIKKPNKLELGNGVVISRGAIMTCSGGVKIEDNVLIGYGAKVISANHIVPDDRTLIKYAGHKYAEVKIKEGAWICANSVILPGITVGEGAIVSAGAVVTKDVPPFVFVGGVPAKIIKARLNNG